MVVVVGGGGMGKIGIKLEQGIRKSAEHGSSSKAASHVVGAGVPRGQGTRQSGGTRHRFPWLSSITRGGRCGSPCQEASLLLGVSVQRGWSIRQSAAHASSGQVARYAGTGRTWIGTKN